MPGPCVWAGVALEWVQGNWSAGPGGNTGPGGGPEGEEAGSGSGFGSGYGGTEWAEGGAMLNAIWETEGLQTVGIVVLVFASIKLLHLLGLINFSEGKTHMGKQEDSGRERVIEMRRRRAHLQNVVKLDNAFPISPFPSILRLLFPRLSHSLLARAPLKQT